MDKKEKIALLKIILLMILVIALGLFAINQGMGAYYKAQLLLQPCELCKQLHPIQNLGNLIINITK